MTQHDLGARQAPGFPGRRIASRLLAAAGDQHGDTARTISGKSDPLRSFFDDADGVDRLKLLFDLGTSFGDTTRTSPMPILSVLNISWSGSPARRWIS